MPQGKRALLALEAEGGVDVLNTYLRGHGFFSNLASRLLTRVQVPGVYPRYPLGSTPRGGAEAYLELFDKFKSAEAEAIQLIEKTAGFRVDRAWLDELALATQVVIKSSPLNWFHGRVLYSLLRSYLATTEANESVVVFETGTARGFSAIVMARALRDSGFGGMVVTVDYIPHNKPIFWNCIGDQAGPQTRHSLLEPWAPDRDRVIFIQGWSGEARQRIGIGRIHFAFLDAQHTKEAVLEEYRFVRDRQCLGDVVVFDDVTPGTFDGVVDAVDVVRKEGLYEVETITSSDSRGYAVAVRRGSEE